jgi:hypothetical protein
MHRFDGLTGLLCLRGSDYTSATLVVGTSSFQFGGLNRLGEAREQRALD